MFSPGYFRLWRRTLILSASGSEQRPGFLRPQHSVGRTFVSSRLWTITITIYFIHPSGKLKLSPFDRTTKNISQHVSIILSHETEGDLNFCIRSTPLGEHFVNSKLRTAEGDFNFCVRSSPLGEHVSVLGFEQRETPISASAVPDCGAQARASRTATIKINKKWQHEGLN